jgi:hypothetical protein
MARTSKEILDQEFLQARAKLLEVAAFFDRLQAAAAVEFTAAERARLDQLMMAIRVVEDDQPDKAARLQMLFSRRYEADWREQFDLHAAR